MADKEDEFTFEEEEESFLVPEPEPEPEPEPQPVPEPEPAAVDEAFLVEEEAAIPGLEEEPPPPPRRQGSLLRILLLVLLLVILGGAAFYYFTGVPEPAPPLPRVVKKQPVPVPHTPVPVKPRPPAAPEQPAVAKKPEAAVPATPEKPAAPAPKVVSPPAKATPAAPAPAAARAKAPAPAAAGKYGLQAGVLLLPKSIRETEATLRKLGFEPQVTSVTREIEMTRLLVGTYPLEAARDKVEELRPQIPEAFLLAHGNQGTVYAGSYRVLAQARQAAETLAAKGIRVDEDPVLVPMTLQRITCGSFVDRSAAEAAAARLKAAGVDALVVTHR